MSLRALGAERVRGFDPVALQLLTLWTTANITSLSTDKVNGTYLPVYGPTGTEAMVTIGTHAHVILSPPTVDHLRGLRFLKLRSGTEASPVNLTDDRIINMLVRQGA